MSVTLSGDTGLTGAATGALNGTLGATTPNTVAATTVNATTVATTTVTASTPIGVASGGTGLAAVGSSGNTLVSNGTSWTSGKQTITSGTAKAWNWNGLTTNTSIDFTDIPSWVKRITVMLDAVSTSGTSIVMIRIGPVGGIESTGYAAHSGTIEGTGIGSLDHTTGFGISQAGAAAYTFGGFFTLCNLSGNTWALSGSARQASTRITMSAGSKTLAAVLTQVRLTTVNGTDTFDAGSINILYE